jgi:integrase
MPLEIFGGGFVKKSNPRRSTRKAQLMAKKRGSGEGSIYHARDGRWRGEVSIGYKPDGRPRRRILYGSTRLEVSEQMKRVLRELQVGLNVAPGKQTVAQFLTRWLEDSVKPKNRAETYRSYEWIVRVHLIPHLGRIQLDKLSPQRLQTFLNERHESGLNPTTVKHINATLRAALSLAHRWQMVHQNAAKLVTLPRAEKYVPHVLDPEGARKLLAATSEHQHSAMFSVALSLGLRRGEVIGLRWRDVDFEGNELRVRSALGRVKGKGMVLAGPKSNASKRLLRLPKVCAAALLKQRKAQAERRRWAGAAWRESDYVFTNGKGGPIAPEVATREFAAALKDAGLPAIRLHDLRHSCATLLLVQGVHPKLVQDTLGHSSFQLTMDTYSHILPSLKTEVASKMDDIFAAPTKSPTKAEREAVN